MSPQEQPTTRLERSEGKVDDTAIADETEIMRTGFSVNAVLVQHMRYFSDGSRKSLAESIARQVKPLILRTPHLVPGRIRELVSTSWTKRPETAEQANTIIEQVIRAVMPSQVQ
ncbi:hypothetical protein M0P48_05750 [Candidatus Gracilibacteria bacterium]|nr:hypothetical protein [Candidatus Gracilibacteria bacterium]